jgi:hypothetical protein
LSKKYGPVKEVVSLSFHPNPSSASEVPASMAISHTNSQTPTPYLPVCNRQQEVNSYQSNLEQGLGECPHHDLTDMHVCPAPIAQSKNSVQLASKEFSEIQSLVMRV